MRSSRAREGEGEGDAEALGMPAECKRLLLDVSSLPGTLRLGKVRAVVSAARLLALKRRFDDQARRLDEVLLLRRPDWKSLLDAGKRREREAQSFRGACDARVLPHQR